MWAGSALLGAPSRWISTTVFDPRGFNATVPCCPEPFCEPIAKTRPPELSAAGAETAVIAQSKAIAQENIIHFIRQLCPKKCAGPRASK